MNFFDAATLRLKQQLKVTENKQVAEALGMTGNAWTMRKRRGAFPEVELRALAQQRPELGIDVGYVLTGASLTEHQRQKLNQLQSTPGVQPVFNDENQTFTDLAHDVALEMAMDNKRGPIYAEIIDELRACTDETVNLVLVLVLKLSAAEREEAAEADRTHRNEETIKKMIRSTKREKRQ